MKQISVKNAKKWAKALRSGEYKQSKGMLNNREGYCCLGVACKIFIPENKLELWNDLIVGNFPEEQKYSPQWLKDINDNFERRSGLSLSVLNDTGELNTITDPFTFDVIADLIELIYVHKAL